MLGQLGLGRLGTSKGRLLPTLNQPLHKQFPQGIIDISAGHNFTVALTELGEAYSFGHSEYNQHGSQAYDYTDPYHYYLPRKMELECTSAPLTKVICGSCYSMALDQAGRLYSWGWNEGGTSFILILNLSGRAHMR